ncbi:MAG TPA: hypothetical protein VNS81_09375 [Nocardioides sp.]|nr:hypothetical protein [Nocardioides sp.]
MLFVVIAVLVSLAAAGLVVLYVAYPHRGERVPYAPWLGEAMERAADAAPVIEEEEIDLLRSSS